MRKVTNQIVANVHTATMAFSTVAKGIPVKLGYAIAKHYDSIQKHLADIEKCRIAACEKYSAKNEKGEPKTLEDGSYDIADMDSFQKEFQELLMIEVEVPEYQVSIADLPNEYIMPEFQGRDIFINYYIKD
jgi:adenylosuccinate lyase